MNKKSIKMTKNVLTFLAIGTFTFFAISSGSGKESNDSDNSSNTEQKATSNIGVGQVLQTDYFEITANKVSVKNSVSTGNEFADLKAEQGNKYLIINATFKNIDKESRMLTDGSVFINYNGKDYEFDKAETVMLEGWGTMLDQINPLTSKTTNLVYKLPAEITGTALWNPGRSDGDQTINLGEIK